MIDFSLYLITDRKQTNGRPLAEVVVRAMEGGVTAVQLREKDLPSRQLFDLATELRHVTREYGAKLLINDRPDIALAVGADGVHTGAASLPVAVSRRILGAEMLIGYSAHAVDEAFRAAAAGADFVTFGPVYPTPSKAIYGAPLGVAKLAAACRSLPIPVFALGGIKEITIPEVMGAGAHGIALISAVMAAPDPAAAAAEFIRTTKQYARTP